MNSEPEGVPLDSLLVSQGLETYVPAFRNHAIRSDVLVDLTHDDLIEVGVSSLGHRLRILQLASKERPRHGGASSAATDSKRPSILPGMVHSAPHIPTLGSSQGRGAPSLLHSSLSTGPPSAPVSATAVTYASSSSGTRAVQSLEKSTVTLDSLIRDNESLCQRVDLSEKQIKRLNDQVTRLRAELFRRFKESEPLPTPGAQSVNRQDSKRRGSHSQDTYFTASRPGFGTPATSPSTTSYPLPSSFHGPATGNGARATTHVFHGHIPTPLGPPSATSSTTTPSQISFPTAPDSKMVLTSPLEPFKKIRCSEHDNAAKVLAATVRKHGLDSRQWRLQIAYADEVRDLYDEEYPLVVFRSLQMQGYKPMFHIKEVTPPKPPLSGPYI